MEDMMDKNKVFKLMSSFESYSRLQIEQVNGGWYDNNKDIRWFSNCVGDFDDDIITEFYLNDHYARETRWNLWNYTLGLFKKHKIKSNLDVGCANNHFSFLCNKKDIFSVGFDPREDCVYPSESVFRKTFGSNQYGYVGNIKTFIDFFKERDEVLFDCISILNFLHGNGHIPQEIYELFLLLPKITKYVMISEPQWDQLRLPKFTDNYELLETIKCQVTTGSHMLYKI